MLEIYSYFNGKEYNKDNIETIPNIFDDVVAFEISDLGAMGEGGLLLLITKDSKEYPVAFTEHSYRMENGYEVDSVKYSKAFHYINEKMNNILLNLFALRHKIRDEENGTWIYTPLNHADGWGAAEGDWGWYISAKNKYFDKLPKKEFKGNDFVTTSLIGEFPILIKEMLKAEKQ